MTRNSRRTAPLAALLAVLLAAQGASATSWLPIATIGGHMAGPGALAMVSPNIVGIGYTVITNFIPRVYFRRSTDGGASWQSGFPITPAGVDAHDAALFGRGAILDMVWLQEDEAGDHRAYYGRSVDGGVNWINIKPVSQAGVSAYTPRVARDSDGRVAVVWTAGDMTDGWAVYSRVSLDSGLNFQPRQNLDATSSVGSHPNVAIGKYGKIHVAFYDSFQVIYRRSADDGVTWSNPVQIVAGVSGAPTIVANGRTVLIGYTDTGPGTSDWVAYRRSVDNGSHWQSQVNLATTAGKDTFDLILSFRAGTWRAEYRRCSTTDPCDGPLTDLVIRSSVNGADSWTSSELVPTSPYGYPVPAGISGGDKTIVAWMQHTGSQYIGVYARRAQ